jgi:O-antigen/teichoic acid export membrane protein
MSEQGAGYRPIGSNTGLIFASQTIGSILRATYAAVLARKLGPELFGLMNYGLGWYATFLAVANLQLESHMSREIALNPGRAPEVLSGAMTLRTFSTILVLAVAIGTALSSGDGALLSTVLVIYAVAMAGRSAAMWCSSAFISRESAWQVFKIEIIFRLAEVVLGISALLAGYGLIAIAVIHAVSWWAQAVFAFALVRGHLPGIQFRASVRGQAALLRTVLPVALASIGATWLMQGPFVLFKDKAAVGSDLGVVALVLQIYILLTGIPVALGRAALPALSRTVRRTDNKDALFLGLVLRAAIPATTLLVIGASTFGAWVVALIFGEAYREAGQDLAYGMMLVLPFGLGSIANQILIAHDKTWQAMTSAMVGAAAMTVFARFLMPSGGAAADYFLCILAGTSTWAIVALAMLSRVVVLDWRKCLAMPVLAGCISCGLYYLMAGSIGNVGSLAAAGIVLLAGQRIFGIVDRSEAAILANHFLERFGRGPRTR